MELQKKKELLADILDADPDEITPEAKLKDLGDWDSLAILSFISMMDEEFGREVKGSTVKELVTAADAFAIMEEDS